MMCLCVDRYSGREEEETMYVCVTHRTGKHNLERWHTNTHTDTHTHAGKTATKQ